MLASVGSSSNISRSSLCLSEIRDNHVRCWSMLSALPPARGGVRSRPSDAAESARGATIGATGAAAAVGEAGTRRAAPSLCGTTSHCAT